MAKQGVISESDDDDQKDATNAEVVLDDPNAAKEKKDDEPQVEVRIADEEKEDDKGDSHLDVGGELDDGDTKHRETSKERRERAKKAKERDRNELRFQKALIDQLQAQISQLSVHTAETRVQTIDGQIAAAQADVARFQQIQAAAIKAQNGEDAVAAEKYVRDATAQEQRLLAEKERLQNAVRQAPQQQRQPVAWEGQARKFLSDKPWYDSNGRDQDSLVVTAIDKALLQEHFDPRGEEYWEELEARTRKMLPHRFSKKNKVADDDIDDDDADDDTVTVTRTRKGPPVGGGRSAQGKPGVITLSRERVQALKDAGMWDDPKTRQKMAVKYFAEWDKEHAASRRATP